MSSSSKIAAAIALAAVLISAALLLRPTPNRYQFKLTRYEMRWFDTATGTLVACDGEFCEKFDGRGKSRVFKKQDTTGQRKLLERLYSGDDTPAEVRPVDVQGPGWRPDPIPPGYNLVNEQDTNEQSR